MIAKQEEGSFQGDYGDIHWAGRCILVAAQCEERDTAFLDGFNLFAKEAFGTPDNEGPECSKSGNAGNHVRLLLDDADFGSGDTSAFEADVARESMDAPVADT